MTLQHYDNHSQNRNQNVTEFSNDVYVYGKLYADLVGGLTGDGGALEVGKSSTKAVVYSSVVIIVSNYLLTQLLLGS